MKCVHRRRHRRMLVCECECLSNKIPDSSPRHQHHIEREKKKRYAPNYVVHATYDTLNCRSEYSIFHAVIMFSELWLSEFFSVPSFLSSSHSLSISDKLQQIWGKFINNQNWIWCAFFFCAFTGDALHCIHWWLVMQVRFRMPSFIVHGDEIIGVYASMRR